ncbi:MAG: hypothetical protein AAFQ80_15100 [Cyanobacteria bacterium J06621_8]
MTNLLDIENIPYGDLSSEDSRVLTRIYSTLLLEGSGLRIQWDDPNLLAQAANVEVDRAASILKYLEDNNLTYYDEDDPGLYLRYKALPDSYRRNYFNY